MRDLYQTIRTHRGSIAKALQTYHEPERKGFLQALLSFERHTRGHQHTLDGTRDPHMDASGAAKRIETSKALLSSLLTAFSCLTQADWPSFDGLDELLSAKDGSGTLQRLTLRELQTFATFYSGLPRDISINASACVFHDGELRITLTFENRRQALRATRQLIIKMTAPDDLRSARLALRDGKRALKKLFAGFSTWPEFSEQAQNKQAFDRASTALRKLLQGMSDTERQQLALNWNQFKPSCL